MVVVGLRSCLSVVYFERIDTTKSGLISTVPATFSSVVYAVVVAVTVVWLVG